MPQKARKINGLRVTHIKKSSVLFKKIMRVACGIKEKTMNREIWAYAYRLYQDYSKKLQESDAGNCASVFSSLCRVIDGYRENPEAWALMSGVYAMLEAQTTKRHAGPEKG